MHHTRGAIEGGAADRALQQIDDVRQQERSDCRNLSAAMSQIVFDEKMVARLEAIYATRDVKRFTVIVKVAASTGTATARTSAPASKIRFIASPPRSAAFAPLEHPERA